MTLPIAVLISGRGSNLQAIIDGIARGELPAEIRVVISNRPGAQGLLRARQAGIPVQVLDSNNYDERVSFDKALSKLIEASGAELILLAGFMRILSPLFITNFAGRILNIHPSLLPDFPGLNTHERAIKAKSQSHGASVHFVTEELDGGPVIVQSRVPILPEDDPDTLAARVLEQEHILYGVAVRWYAEGRVRLGKDCILMDGKPLSKPILLTPDSDNAGQVE